MSVPVHDPEDFLPLTPLSTAILVALAEQELHGYGIIKELERQSGGRRVPGAGTLYAALDRMVRDGLLEEMPGSGDAGSGPPRRYYGLTDLGREVAQREVHRMAGLLTLAVQRKLVPDLRLAFGGTGE